MRKNEMAKCDYCGKVIAEDSVNHIGNNTFCEDCLHSGDICKEFGHIWESQAGSFTHESGFTNYSLCLVCGKQTRSYQHGDFEDEAEAENEFA